MTDEVTTTPPDVEAMHSRNQERLGRLQAQGKLDPFLLLKMRVDVITELLMPQALHPVLEYAWEQALEGWLNELESKADLVVASSIPDGGRAA